MVSFKYLRNRSALSGWIAAGMVLSSIPTVAAQTAPAKPQPPVKAAPVQSGKKAPDPAPAAKTTVAIPDSAKLTLMIQINIAALSLGNLTNNYTVLRDLGSPAFQSVNTPAVLSEKFKGFRQKAIDISPALLFAPILVGPPKVDADDVMHVTGFYNTSPQRIVFDLSFQPLNNAWRLAGIGVQTVVPNPEAQALPAVPPAAAANSKAPSVSNPNSTVAKK